MGSREGRSCSHDGCVAPLPNCSAQTEQELHAIARSHDWDLDGVGIFELAPRTWAPGATGKTILESAEVELNESAPRPDGAGGVSGRRQAGDGFPVAVALPCRSPFPYSLKSTSSHAISAAPGRR